MNWLPRSTDMTAKPSTKLRTLKIAIRNQACRTTDKN